ncbi:MAG: hypothetical protein WCP69_09495 [Bacteroidota bacterium]
MKAKTLILLVLVILISSCSVQKRHKHSIKTGNNGVGMDVKRTCGHR